MSRGCSEARFTYSKLCEERRLLLDIIVRVAVAGRVLLLVSFAPFREDVSDLI
jgi:hypothetical protein